MRCFVPDTDKRSDRELSAIRNYPLLLRRYARLVEVTTDLASRLDLESLLQHIVDAAKELTECEAASLLMYDAPSQQLYFEAATNELAAGVGRQTVPTESSLAGWVFTHGEPLVVDHALTDPRFFREVDVLTRFRTQSVLGVPLRTHDKTLGVIEAINKRKGRFDEQDVRLLQALAAQAAIAIQNSRLFQQSDIVAVIAHELRTPLSALMAAAYLLQRPDLPKEQQQKLGESIYTEVKRLNEMTTDFLELARLESGRIRFTREPVDLAGLVRECLEVIRPQAEADRLRLETQVDPALGPVYGDRNRLKQVVLNLLTNAIKYNQKGGLVRVSVSAEGSEAVLSVTDTGRGIPPESLPRVFERFYRVPDQEASTAGTGLGLAIAKRIVESNQGTIGVTSEVGKGSTFTVRLPLTP
jgi:signal transduction histidine kinase